MAHWRIELLGGLRVVSCAGGRQVISSFESRKTATLLAYLALHPERAHAREELAALIWPDAAFEASRNRLKQSLASLRRQLEPPGVAAGAILDSGRFAIRLRAGAVEVDVTLWEKAARERRLQDAVALWKGELLPGFYDDWLTTERERLNALRESLPPLESAPTPPEPLPARAPGFIQRIPATASRFYGREGEMGQLLAWLAQERWVTVQGTGGMGKTRLAIEVAQAWEQSDVIFVPLAEVEQVERPQALALALELPLRPSPTPQEQVQTYLSGQPMLLVLDNGEQLVDQGLGHVLRALLEALPQLRLLVTSRRQVGGEGERVLPLEPLAAPELPGTPESLVEFPAVQLFIDRAQRIQPDFQVTPRNALALGELCRRLDGVPLALELVAAWAQTLSPAQMLERLGDERLLRSRRRDLPDRHRSLRAAFEGNLRFLTPVRCQLLAAIALFRGGWTVEAIEAICPTDDTLEDLLTLTEASLVRKMALERFSMLESLRPFAQERLEPAERTAFLQRHYAYYLVIAEGFPTGRWDPAAELLALEAIQADLDNLRLAIEGTWERGEAVASLTLALALRAFVSARGSGTELVGWLERGLTVPLPDALRGSVLVHLGGMELERRNNDQALAHILAAQELAQQLASPTLEALSLYQLGRHANLQLDTEQARHYFEAALQSLDDPAYRALAYSGLAQGAIKQQDAEAARAYLRENEWEARQAGRSDLLADALYSHAYLAMVEGDLVGAMALLKECQQTAQRFGMTPLLARVQNSIGSTAQHLGEERQARDAFLESARLFLRLRSLMGLSYPLWNLGRIYLGWREWEVGLPLLACSLRLYEEIGLPVEPEDRAHVQQARQDTAAHLGAARTEALWQRGTTLSPDAALRLVEASTPEFTICLP